MSNFDENYYIENYREYNSHSPKYKLNYYNKIISEFLDPLILNPKIHDFGCAYGNFLFNLDERFSKFGSDISEFAIEKAQEKNALTNQSITFRKITDPHPFSGNEFDLITAFDVLEHIPDLELSILSIYSQLKSGGIFVFVVPVYDGLSGPLIRKLDKDPTHLHKWNRDRWLQLISSKFHVAKWEGIFRYNFFGRFYAHFSTSLIRKHTPAIIVVCKKI